VRALALSCTLLVGASALAADSRFTIRLSTPAPEGTAWAREIHGFARDVEITTNGDVRLKVVWGGIAGDDVQVAERIDRNQLDGVMSGGMLCEQRAPTNRALRLVGLFRDYGEANWVAGQLRDTIEKEAREHGYVYLADAGLGAQEIFSREPLRTFAELKAAKLWNWDLDGVSSAMLKEMGLHLVELPIDKAGPAFASGQHDGFVSIPGAMLAFQWAAQTHYVSEVHLSYLIGCVMVANRAFDRLPAEHQQAVRLAAARFRARMNGMVVNEDARLLGGAFGRQGVKNVPVAAELRAQLEEAARAARERLRDKLVPAALVQRVLALVGEYRQSHQQRAGASP